MENHTKWEIAVLGFAIVLSGATTGELRAKLATRTVLGAELSIPQGVVLIASLNPNFEKIEIKEVSESATSTLPVYKPTFYPVWWDGYEDLRKKCSCESYGTPELEPRQFREDGSLLRGYPNPNDVGACQISTIWWGKKAKELGLDIEGNYFDNIKMAKYILSVQPDAWKYSKRCWSKENE